jgi:O-antigen ligase
MRRLNMSVTSETMKRLAAMYGIALCTILALAVVCNQYSAIININPYYRIQTPTLFLLFGFVTACVSTKLAIMGCVFLLPLLPTFSWQFQLYTGYGRIQDIHGAGLDLASGILLGTIAQQVFRRQPLRQAVAPPWTAGLVLLILTASVALAISRNLYQTQSVFTFNALIFNLFHLRSLGWHDDYRPLLDLVSYACAASILAIFIPALKRMPDRNDVVFKPLICGLVIAALVGWRQSQYAAGLTLAQLNFRSERFGFMALGFQPDIHAFGAHMLIGAIGILGYLHYKNNWQWRTFLLVTVIPLCWIVLFMSKSKSTFLVAILMLITITGAYSVHRFVRNKRLLLVIGLISGFALLLLTIALAGFWYDNISAFLERKGLLDWITLNQKLSYRPEVYLAAFRMFSLFPLTGLGQGEFYRLSSNHDLTQSFFLSQEQNGENAHNYFLQTLIETGFIGFCTFALLVLYPLLKTQNRLVLIPGAIALAAIFGGNLFSHSMLVRENLLLAACFLALLYSWVEATEASADAIKSILTKKRWILGSIVLLLISVIAVRELRQPLSESPFKTDNQCIESNKLWRDGWTTGTQILDVPVGARGGIIHLDTTQPDVSIRPLPLSISVWFDQRLLVQSELVLNKTGPQSIEVLFPEGTQATPDDYHIELKVQRCFIPRNFGMNQDGRRLGIKIKTIDWR